MNATEVQADPTDEPRRSRKPRERRRRDYAGDLKSLQGRVDAAIHLLAMVDAGPDAKLVKAAVEMLNGE